MSRETFEWWKTPCTISQEFITRGKIQANSSAMVEQRREEGKDVSTIPGLSRKADAIRRPHGGAYTTAVASRKRNGAQSMSSRLREVLEAYGPLTRAELASKSGIDQDKISGLIKRDVQTGRVIVIVREGDVMQFQIGEKA
jgi:hypothetical protein